MYLILHTFFTVSFPFLFRILAKINRIFSVLSITIHKSFTL